MIKSMERHNEKHYTFMVASKTSDNVYPVECHFISGDDVWDAYCTCKGFAHRSDCWHIKMVKEYATKYLAKPAIEPKGLLVKPDDVWLRCPICNGNKFGVLARDLSVPYRGEPNKVVCFSCGRVSEFTGMEGKFDVGRN
jgi:hypothetical protein